MASSCKGVMEDLAKCIAESSCMEQAMAKDSSAKDAAIKACMAADECAALRYTYAECKRSQVNMRSRIQGNKGY